jgi:predicted nucleic acid-binding protein
LIVVDTNVVAYCWIRGPLTPLAQRVRVADPAWHAPLLWRSEMRSILAGYLRSGSLTFAHVASIMRASEAALANHEHLVDSDRVLDIVRTSDLSAYDAEFVALARAMAAPLVTADNAILRAARDVAQTMEAFLAK